MADEVVARQTPEWFACGAPVDDVYERSIDAPYIFDDGVEVDGIEVGWNDLAWRECLIPIAEFGCPFVSLDEHLLALKNTSAEEQRQRGQEVVDWVAAAGGIEKALSQSPLLVTLRAGKVTIEDGYHRLGVAAFVHGATEVRALCSDMSLRSQPAMSLSM